MSEANLLICIQAASIVLCFVSLYVMLYRDQKLQQRNLEYVIFGCVIANIGMAIEVSSKGANAVILEGKGVEMIGVSVFMISLLALTGFVCNIHVPMWFTGALIVADGILVAMHFSEHFTYFFYQDIKILKWHEYSYMTVSLGVAGVIYWLVSVVFPCLACFIMLIYTAIQDANPLRRKDYVQLAAIYLGLFIVLFLHGEGILTAFYNPTMLIASIVFCIFVFSKWRYQGIDVVSAAAQTAIDSIDAGIITLNQFREILYFNEAAKKIVPEISYCMGLNIDSLSMELPNLKPGDSAEFQFSGRKYYISINSIYDVSREVRGYTVMFNDMTEMYNLMEQIKSEQERADEASQIKTMFLTNISHEIRTPMNAIMGLAELIIEESRGRKVYDMAVTIKKASTSLLDLINNVLDISKLESGKMELVEENYSIAEVIDDIMKVMSIPAAQSGLVLKKNIDNTLPCVLFGDKGKIKQCLINLVNNSIKFTEKGSVSMEVSGIRRGDRIALTFIVKDTGVGIKDEDKERIFGVFEQADKIVNKNKEGSGLGLTITRQLVELMGGVIELESTYGVGTTFTLRLTQQIINDTPIEEIDNIVEEIVEDQTMFISPQTRVLVVDDNRVNLMVAQGLLEPYQLQIETAESGESAIEMEKAKDYDIIMMDHMMPGMDGVEATQHILEYCETCGKKPYIVALTANAFGNTEEMFLSHGFKDFVSKPIEKDVLHACLLRAIPDEKREYIDAVVTTPAYTEDDLAEFWMEGVDVRKAFEDRGCSTKDYLELLDLFNMEGQKKIAEIKEAYDTENWKNYSIFTHGLKSTAANIGANDLSAHAKQHEFATKDENNLDLDFVRKDVDSLLEQYKALLGEADRVVTKMKAMNTEAVEEKLEGMTEDLLAARVEEIIEVSEDFRTKEAAEMVDELLKYALDKEVEKKLSDIRMKYKLYDDDGAEALLYELKEMVSDGTDK